jgi:uncharacterized SAM-binding protein YcdF (DUF218 family)
MVPLDFVDLSQEFPQARLVYSGLEGSDVENLLATFVRLGGDPERLTVETRSRNTFENALYTKELIKPKAQERWLVIARALHMPRAIGCFRRVGFKVEAHPIVYTEAGTGIRALSTLDQAMREWIGLLVYRVTGKTNELFPAP